MRIVTNSYCEELFVLFLWTVNAMRAPLAVSQHRTLELPHAAG